MTTTLSQTGSEIQVDLNAVEDGNIGLTSITDLSDTTVTAAKKSGYHSLQASSSNAPSSDRSVIISAVRNTAASGQLRYGQVVLTESNKLFFNTDDGGVLGTWREAVSTAGGQTLTNKTITGGALNINTISEQSSASGVTIDSVLLKDNTVLAGTLTVGAGSITDSSGAINFGNENLSTTGALAGGALAISGNVDVGGIIEFDAISGTGSVTITDIVDEDNMASDSPTKLATQQSIKAYVDAQVDTADTLSEVLALGNTTGGTDIATTTTDKVQFRDSAIYIHSSTDGQLDIVSDGKVQIASNVDLNGNLDVSGTALVTGVLTTTATQVATGGITSGSNIVSDTDSTDDLGTTSVRWANLFVDGITATDQITATGFTGTLDGILGSGAAAAATVTTLDTSGAVNLNLVTDSSSSTSGALIVDGGVGIAKKLYVGTDLDVDGTANLDIVDIDGAVNMATTALVTGVLTTTATQVATGGITSGADIISDTDSTDSLGSTAVRWLKGWFDTLTAGTLTIGSGSVTDSSGAISFGNENLTTTGTATAASLALATGATVTGVDNGTLGTSATLLATQGAIKTYVDAQVDTADTLAEVLALGNTTGGTDLAVSAGDDITFTDSSKAIFGAGSDLQIYHDGSNSWVSDQGTGQLILESGGAGVYIQKGASETMANFIADGAVSLYHNNVKKIETTALGISVAGAATFNAGAVFNESSIDSDFRVESNGNANMLFVDGGSDHVNIGTASDYGGMFNVNGKMVVKALDGALANDFIATFQNGEETNSQSFGVSIAAASTGSDIALNVVDHDASNVLLRVFGNGATTIGGSVTATGATLSGDLNLDVAASPSIVLVGGDGNSKNIFFKKQTGDTEEARIKVLSNNMILDVKGEIHLDADDGVIRVQDAAGDIGMFQMTNSDFIIRSMVSDKDIIFKGLDGSSVISALTLDMSDFGSAAFNAAVDVGTTLTAQKLVLTNGVAGQGNANLKFSNSADAITPANSSGSNNDNAIDLGSSSARFDDIYATNATIQTSDRNEKQDIAELSDAEQRVAVACKGLLRKFRWKSSVAEKGDKARTHFGIIAQDLEAAFVAEGLDASDYAMFINTAWTDEETSEEKIRMGVRYSELLAFIISAI